MLRKYIDFTLLKYLTIFYTVAVLIDLGRKIYWKLDGTYYQTISWQNLLVFNILLDWVVMLLFMTFISYLAKRMFEKKINWKRIILIHFFFSFLIGYVVFAVASLAVYLLGDFTLEKALENLAFRHFLSVVDVNFLAYFSMTGIIYIYYYIKKVKKIEQQKSQLQLHLSQTKLNMLKAQLHPHFMFNTLNSISSLIEIDKEKAQNLIADFGDLFRDILAVREENVIPLEQELAMLDKYLAIVSIRFSDHLQINRSIEKGLEKALVPNMILQPLLENAIKHGYSYHKTELIISLAIFKEEKSLHIKIENNGELLSTTFNELINKGIGLKNTVDKLAALFDDDFEFNLTNNQDGTGVVTHIKIPFSQHV